MVIFTSNFQSLLQLVDLNLCDRIYPSAKLRGLKGEGCLFERTLIREGAYSRGHLFEGALKRVVMALMM